MRAGRVNSGHASKFNRAGLFCARAQAHLRVRGSPNQFARYPLLCGQFRRSTWSRNWRVARVISAFTLCQYEHALSQINNGIRVSFGSYRLRKPGLEHRSAERSSVRMGRDASVCQAKQSGRRDRSSSESVWRPPCCRGITLRRVALAPGGGADRSCSVWSTIASFGFTREQRRSTTGRDVWPLRMR